MLPLFFHRVLPVLGAAILLPTFGCSNTPKSSTPQDETITSPTKEEKPAAKETSSIPKEKPIPPIRSFLVEPAKQDCLVHVISLREGTKGSTFQLENTDCKDSKNTFISTDDKDSDLFVLNTPKNAFFFSLDGKIAKPITHPKYYEIEAVWPKDGEVHAVGYGSEWVDVRADGTKIENTQLDTEHDGPGTYRCANYVLRNDAWVIAKDEERHHAEGDGSPFCYSRGSIIVLRNKIDRLARVQPIEIGLPLKIQGVDYEKTNDYDISWSWVTDASLGVAVETIRLKYAEADAFFKPHRYVQRWDGSSWHSFPSLQGDLHSYAYLGDDLVYLCTSQGYGVFHAKTGKDRYWKQGTCPVFNHQRVKGYTY